MNVSLATNDGADTRLNGAGQLISVGCRTIAGQVGRTTRVRK